MRVTNIEVHRVTLPYDSDRADELIRYHDLTGRTIYIAHTDSGLTGLGESEGVEREEVLAQYIGSNPFDWIGDETSLGLGMAMYDLMGKAAGVPVYKLCRSTHSDARTRVGGPARNGAGHGGRLYRWRVLWRIG